MEIKLEPPGLHDAYETIRSFVLVIDYSSADSVGN